MNQYGSRKSNEATIETRIMREIQVDPTIKTSELAARIGTKEQTIKEYISRMKRNKKIKTVKLILPMNDKFSIKKL